MSIDQPVAFSQPFIHDENTTLVVWTCKVIRQVHGLGCRLAFWGVGTPHPENNPIVSFLGCIPTSFVGHKYAGTTGLAIFER
jgi:hypothetical protein